MNNTEVSDVTIDSDEDIIDKIIFSKKNLKKFDKIHKLIVELLEDNKGFEDHIMYLQSSTVAFLTSTLFGIESAREMFNDAFDSIKLNTIEEDISDESEIA